MSIKLKDTIYDLISNSDKLDGKHNEELTAIELVKTASGELDVNKLNNSYFRLKFYSAISSDSSNIPTSSGWQNALLEIPLHSNGVSSQFYFSASKPLYYRPFNEGDWKEIAFTDSNVISASKLETPRTISLTGAITGSGNFDGSANLSISTSVNHSHSQYYDSNVSRTANTILAAPNGNSGTASFRNLVSADLPALPISKITNLQSFLDGKAPTDHSHDSRYYTKSEVNNFNVFSTQRDFGSGTLIKTNIDYSKNGGEPFYGEIKGNNYGEIFTHDTKFQGYIYSGTIINYGVTHLTPNHITPIVAMNIDGNLCFWFPRLSYWQGFSIKITTGYNYSINRVTSVSDSSEPSGTKKVTLTSNTRYVVHSGNISDQSVYYSSYSGTATNSNAVGGWSIDDIFNNVLFKSNPKLLDRSHNLNDYTKGYFGYSDAYDPANSYDTNSAMLALTSARGVDCWQIVFAGNSSASKRPELVVRSNFANQGWSSWHRFAYKTDNVASASKLETSRTISLSGSVTGSASFDGSSNITISTSTNHNHSISWNDISGKPTEFWPSSHSHEYYHISGSSAYDILTSNVTTFARNKLINAYLGHGSASFAMGWVLDGYNSSPYSAFLVNSYGDNWYFIGSSAGYWTHRTVIHSGNIGSQSVNYATSAGSANSVSWGNVSGKPSTFTPSSHSHSNYMTTSSPTGSGTLMMNGSNSRGSYPAVKWHIGNVNWAQIIMNGSGELEFRGGASQDTSYITARMGACVCTSLYVGGEQITFTT